MRPPVASAIDVRPAHAQELGEFARLRALMAAGEGHAWDAEHPGWRERFAAYFAGRQLRGEAQVFFATHDGRVAGAAAFSIVDEYRVTVLNQPRGWVNSVYVLPEFRRRGVARRLMEAGIAWLRERGCVKVRLRTSDEGEPLYAALGFRPGRELELDL